MREHTIQRLRELEHAADNGRRRDHGNHAKAVAEHRDAMAVDAEQIATAAGAPINTARGIMLLFDVLVGITVGTLAHDQGYWHSEVVRDAELDAVWNAEQTYPWSPACGTYRCVAGWLAHITNPGATPILAQHLTGDGYVRHRAEVLKLTDGTVMPYDQAGALALGVTIERTRCVCELDDHAIIRHPVERLFDGMNTLADLWTLAEKYTGGALTAPADLAPMIAAQTGVSR